MLRSQNPATISDFIAQYPAEMRAKLEEMRQLVHDVCPEAEEKIAYGIPTFTWHGNLVHFSAYKTHIGFYPGSGPLEELRVDLLRTRRPKVPFASRSTSQSHTISSKKSQRTP